MIELLRTNDLVRLSWIQALLADAGVESFFADEHASAAIAGHYSPMQRRLMVHEDDAGRARAILRQAEEHDEDR